MTSSDQNQLPVGLLWLLGFLILVIVPGAVIGVATVPGEWYADLAKPPFNPPNWIFAPVWFVLYVLIGFAGWRTFRRAPKSADMAIWFGQLGLNWLWSPIFFTLHMLWPALVIIAAIWALIAAFIWRTRRLDPLAAWCFVPYLAWVSFATMLNASVAILN